MSEIIASTYEVIEKIGSGGGGTVFLANHLRLNKKVVLKADRHKVTARPELLRREVDVLKDLSHSYIPKVFDFFVEGETVYTVMDYIEGESLDKPLKRGETFPQAQVVIWARQLLEALDYLHSPSHGTPPKGFVHSDIKPANLMRTPMGNICLIDFNIALALGEENVVGCSIGYASPEHYGLDYSQSGTSTKTSSRTNKTVVSDSDKTELLDSEKTALLDGEKTELLDPKSVSAPSVRTIVPDIRSDIYSTGATLYHLLCGRRPAKDAFEVEPLSEKEFSPQIVRIISKAMSPDPNKRYQSAREMLYDFEHLHENDPRYKRLKRVTAVTESIFAAILSVGLFTMFFGLKHMQLTENSLKLSEYSKSAFENGDSVSAVRYAFDASVSEEGLFHREMLPEAEYALANALGVYDLSDGFKAFKTVELKSEPLSAKLSPSGKKASCVCLGKLVIFDTETTETAAELDMVNSALADAGFIDDESVIYAGIDGITLYDIKESKIRWTGGPATSIACGSDSVAAVYKDESRAAVYDIRDGHLINTIDFKGRQFSFFENNIFANTNDKVFALSDDGKRLACSFSDGSLVLFDVDSGEENVILDSSYGYESFEGGFFGDFLSFSASKNGESVYVVYDCANSEQIGGFISDHLFIAKPSATGNLVSTENILVDIDPFTDEQRELVNTANNIRAYDSDGSNTIIASDGVVEIFDRNAIKTTELKYSYSADHVCISGGTALVGSRNSPTIRLLRYRDNSDKEICSYDSGIAHGEARALNNGNFVFFDCYKMRLIDRYGAEKASVDIEDPNSVYDQQFFRDENVLKVYYYDGKVVSYSCDDGSVVTKEQMSAPDRSLYEEFETDEFIIRSPLHGTPEAYDKKTGKPVAELEKDAFLTYVTQMDGYIVAQYTTTGDYFYGVLMNEKCEKLAELPYLCDINGDELIFDYYTGSLRRSRVYSKNELLREAERVMSEE